MTGAVAAVLGLFDLNASASRKRGWLILGVFLAVLVAGELIAPTDASPAADLMLALRAITAVLLIVVLVQRLHATGRSGLWALAVLVPVLGLAAALVILCLPYRPIERRGHPWARRLGGAGLALYGVVVVTRLVWWQPYYIPSESMKPALMPGDVVLATRVGPAGVARGDVVILHDAARGQDFVKRVVGMPGDRVQLRAGVLQLNGSPVPLAAAGSFVETFAEQGPMSIRPRCGNGAVAEGGLCSTDQFLEMLPGGRQHAVLDIQSGSPGDDTGTFLVPEGHVFVMGDNRDNSMDSRYQPAVGGLGFVPLEAVRNRVRLVLFSPMGREVWNIASWRPGRNLLRVE